MDVLLVGFIGGMIFAGWRSGFIRRLLGILFLIIALVLGAYLRYPIGAIASTFFKSIPPEYANLVGYTIAFPLILGGLHLLGSSLIRHTAVAGVEREVDGALGAVFGGVEAILIISALIVIVDTYFGTGSDLKHTVGLPAYTSIASAFNGSTTVHLLRGSTVSLVQGILGPLLPTNLRSIFPQGLPGFPVQTGPGSLPIPGFPAATPVVHASPHGH